MKNNKFVIVTGSCMFLLLMMIIFNIGGETKTTYSATTYSCESGYKLVNTNKCCPDTAPVYFGGYCCFVNASRVEVIGGKTVCVSGTSALQKDATTAKDATPSSAPSSAPSSEPPSSAPSSPSSSNNSSGTCSHGVYSSTEHCSSCYGGYYRVESPDSGIGSNFQTDYVCTKCPDGKACPEGTGAPINCSDTGKIPNADQTACVDATQTSCEKGYYLKDGKCERCTQDHYCTGGTAQPVSCGTVTVQGELLTSKEDCENNTVGSCMDCISNTGERLIREWFARVDSRPTDGSSCGNSQGTWKFAAATLKSNCSTHGITNCDPGYYSKGGTCVKCPAGYYCEGGKLDKKKCDNGYSSNEGAKSKDQCNVAMTLCEANKYYDVDSNSCKSCPSNSILPSAPIATSPAGSTSVTDCKCASGFRINPATKTCIVDCGAGKYISGTTCIQCPANYYCPGNETELDGRKYECPDNSTSKAGSDTIDDCKCNSGYTWNDKTLKCVKGSSSSSSKGNGNGNGGGDNSTPDVNPTPTPGGNDNPTNNPQTGNIMLFVIWIIGFSVLGYSFWYFKNLNGNGA